MVEHEELRVVLSIHNLLLLIENTLPLELKCGKLRMYLSLECNKLRLKLILLLKKRSNCA